MGICCAKNKDNASETIVKNIFLNYTNLCKMNYYKLEQILLEYALDFLITKEDFLKNIIPLLIINKDSSFSKIQSYPENKSPTAIYIYIAEKYLESLFFKKESVNIYFIILILFPLISDSNLSLISNFYKLFCKFCYQEYLLNNEETDASLMENSGNNFSRKSSCKSSKSNRSDNVLQTQSGEFSDDIFKELLIQYFTYNLRITTLTTLSYLTEHKIEDKSTLEEMCLTIHKCFTNENIQAYANKFTYDTDPSGVNSKKKLITLEDFREIFFNRHFVFDFIELRDHFMNEFMYKYEENSIDN
jgi:hypothetical protein